MSDIDSLTIGIQAEDRKASSALDSLEKSLSEISNLLKGMTVSNNMSKGLLEIASATRDIASAVKGLNGNAFKEVGSSAKEASSKIKETAQSMKEFSNAAKSASGDARKVARELAETYNIPKKGNISDLAELVQNMYDAIGTGKGIKSARSDLEDYILSMGRLKEEAGDTYKSVADFVRSAKNVKIPSGIDKEFGEEYAHMRNILGKGFGLNKTGQGFDSFIQELKTVTGMDFSLDKFGNQVHSVQEMFSNLVDYLETGKDRIRSIAESGFYTDLLKEHLDSLFGITPPSKDPLGDFADSLRENAHKILVTTEELATIASSGSFFEKFGDIFTDIQKEFSEMDIFTGNTEGWTDSLFYYSDRLEEITGKSINNIDDLIDAYNRMDNASNIESSGSTIDYISTIGISSEEAAEKISALSHSVGGINLGRFGDSARNISSIVNDATESIRSFSDSARSVEPVNFVVSDSAIENIVRIRNEYKRILSDMQTGKIEFDQSTFDNAVIGFKMADDAIKAYKNELIQAATETRNVADEAEKVSTALSTFRVPNFTFVSQEDIDGYKRLEDVVMDAGTSLVALEHTANAAGTALAKMWDIKMPNFTLGEGGAYDFTVISEGADQAGTALVAMSQSATTSLSSIKQSIIDVEGEFVNVTSGAETMRDAFVIDTSNMMQVALKLNEMALSAEEFKSVMANMNFSDSFRSTAADLQMAQKSWESLTEKLNEAEEKGRVLHEALSMAKTSSEIRAATVALEEHTAKYAPAREEASRLVDEIDMLATKLLGIAGGKVDIFSGLKVEPIDFSALLAPIHGLADIAKKGVSAVLVPFRALASGIEGILNRISRFWGRVMRTLTFMLIRKAITAMIGDINNAMQSLAGFESYIGSRFQQSMSTLVTDLRWVGANIVAAFAPIINAVTPIIDALIDKLVQAITVINQFFAALTGNKVFVKAKKVAQSYGAAVSDAGGAAKKAAKKQKELNEELKDYLLDFDELNVIKPDEDLFPELDDDASPSGGGGGGGGAGAPYEWEEIEIPQEIFDMIDKIKELLGDPFLLGRTISEWLADALNDIPWEKIKKAAEKLGRDFANLLNGLFTPNLFSAVGRTIAEALNTAFSFLNSFGETFNWKGFGTSIAAGINSFFKNFDFKLLASAINNWAKGILDAMITAIKKIDWKMIGNQIGTLLSNIDFKGILSKIGRLIWEAINAAFETYAAMFRTAPLETAILSLVGILALLKTGAVTAFIGAIKSAIGTVIAFGGALSGNIASYHALAAVSPGLASLTQALAAAFAAFNISLGNGSGLLASFSAGVKAFSAGLSTVVKVVGSIVTAFLEFMFVKDAVKNLTLGENTIANWVQLGAAVSAAFAAFSLLTGSLLTGGLLAAIVGITAAIVGYNEAVNELRTEAVAEGFNVLVQSTEGAGHTLHDFIRTMQLTAEEVTSDLDEINDKFRGLSSIEGDIQSAVTSIMSISSAVAQTGSATEGELARIESSFSNLKQSVENYISDMYNALLAQELANVQYLRNRGLWNEEEAAMSAARIADLMAEEQSVKESVTSQIGKFEELKTAAVDIATNESSSAEQISDAWRAAAESLVSDVVPALGDIGVKFDELDDFVSQSNKAFGELKGGLDLSAESIYNTDDLMARLNSTISGMKDAYEPAAQTIRENIDEIKAYGEAHGWSAEQIESATSVSEQRLKDLNSAYTTYLSQIGDDIITIIPNAAKELGNAWDKGEILDGFTGFKTKEEYILAVLTDFANNVYGESGLGSMVETALQGTGLEIEQKSADVLTGAIESMFEAGESTMVMTADGFLMNVKSSIPGKLKDGYEGIFMDAVNGTNLSSSSDALKTNLENAIGTASENSIANADFTADFSSMESRIISQAPLMDEFGTVISTNMTTAISNAVSEADIPSLGQDVGVSLNEGTALGLTESTETVTSAIDANKQLYEETFHTAYEWNSPSGLTVPLGESLNEGIAEGMSTSQNVVTEAISAMAELVTTEVSTISKTMSTGFDGVGEAVTASMSGFKSAVTTSMKNAASAVKSSMNSIKTEVTNSTNSFVSTTKQKFSEMGSNTKTTFNTILRDIKQSWESVKRETTTQWNSISSSLQQTLRNISTNAKNTFTEIQRTIKTTLTSIRNDFTSIWNSISSSLTTTMRNLSTSVKNAMTEMTKSVSEAMSKMKKTAEEAKTAIDNLKKSSSELESQLPKTKTAIENTTTSLTGSGGLKTAAEKSKTAVDELKKSADSLKTSLGNLKDEITGGGGLKTALEGLKTALESAGSAAETAVGKFGSLASSVSSVTSSLTADGGLNSALNTISGTLTSLPQAFTTATNSFNAFKELINGTTLKFKVQVPTFSMNGKFDPEKGTVPTVNVSWSTYAQGGFPEDGFFFANHNELVGKFSNGKTAVANNEQIVGGIQRGVESAVAHALVPYLSSIDKNTERAAAKDPSLYLDGRQLASEIRNREKRNGWSFQVG